MVTVQNADSAMVTTAAQLSAQLLVLSLRLVAAVIARANMYIDVNRLDRLPGVIIVSTVILVLKQTLLCY